MLGQSFIEHNSSKNNFIKILLLSLISCLQISCSSKTPAPNYDLLQPWSKEAQATEPLKPPFVASYKHKNRKLFYIASQHSNRINSPTFKTIRKAINTYKPQTLILEGFQNKNVVSPEWYLKFARKCMKNNFKNCGEAGYTAYLADQNKIPFVAGEPTDKAIYSKLKTKYTPQDLTGFYMVRQIPQMKRHKQLNEKSFSKDTNRLLASFMKKIGEPERFEYLDFIKWYKNRSGEELKIFKLTSDDVAPIASPKASFFQKASYLISKIRDRHILEKIDEQVQQCDRVMIVYGAGHHVVQKKALKAMFGEPKYQKLF